MDADEVEQYFQAVPVIESREMLLALKISDFPHLKKNSRDKIFNKLKKEATPKFFEEDKKVHTAEEAARILMGKIKNV